jgi:hypothetical protein
VYNAYHAMPNKKPGGDMRLVFPAVLMGTWVGISTGYAHHSGTEYEGQQKIEIEGRLLKVNWQNPHVRLRLQSVDRSGRAFVWDIEGNSLIILRRTNTSPEHLKVGDNVKIFGTPSRAVSNHLYVSAILLSNGEEMIMSYRAKPHWTSGAGFKSTWLESDTPPNADAGIFRVWSSKWDDPELVNIMWKEKDKYPLTAAAKKKLAAWNSDTDTISPGCKPKGMPTIMEQPYPMEFVDRGDVILLRMEEYDSVRTIHMNSRNKVDAQPKTLLGYSSGHWDGKTLVVHTDRIKWNYFDPNGVPLGSSASIVERFTPNKDGSRLNYVITVTDPETFTEPVEMKGAWVWRPAEQVKPYGCGRQARS